ncbi:hypothetical protein ELD05_01390 [Caldicellulosiruptor changbaiensis]|uniref:Uncharacterized protein n=1 Tax=Caldicellulosiruptor changbaiensis TaxID=1222016 RepID=A0A3T0D2E7_9FIRM|nr:hypothetical protein [Caldicellulosiruptor changbaiensis]AZT89441.1 hypothetical protein ELD05_01390 [Caldicellulosiruptor changbaiensis]
MLSNSAFTRVVVILKGIEEKDRVPFGYVKVQAIVDTVDLEVVLQGIEEKEEKIALMGIVKRTDKFCPVFFCHLQSPQKATISQLLSTSRFNMFGSGYQLKEIMGFAIIKERKGKRKLLLIGSIDEKDLYTLEKDTLEELEEGKKKEEKKGVKNGNDKTLDETSLNENLYYHHLVAQNNLDTESKKDQEDGEKKFADNSSEDSNLQVFEVISQKAEESGEETNVNEINKRSDEKEELPAIIEKLTEEIEKLENEREKEKIIEKIDSTEDVQPELEKNYCILEFGDKRTWRRIFEELKEKCEKFEPFSDDKVKWMKVDKKDIFRFSNLHPFLYIISNPFVFRLVSDQGYLVIGYKRSKKKKDRIEILVPGEYSEDTEKKAKAFGFSEFVTKDGKVMEGKEGYFKMTLELIEKEE